ncbi:hypothetical protein PoB_000983600 [Plakobranchus ocellatus]|uniref:Kinesin motor domain-containing protein n=1 Tax=Plakobranchus ocellatus TaxID=259542 RepID=A0AAV3Y7U5_9GAST|nr:hypothetical protein PoB_000983600 [Plakobranchus ocellatus]
MRRRRRKRRRSRGRRKRKSIEGGGEVKVAIKDGTAETAGKMFHSAMVFLSQDLPGPACQVRDSQSAHYESDISEEVKALKGRVDALERQAQDDQQEAHTADSMRYMRLTGKLDGLENQVQALDSEAGESIIDLSGVSTENCNAVKALWKLLALLRQKNQLSGVSMENCKAVKALWKLLALLRQKNQEAQTECSTLKSELESVKQEAQNERSTLESELESLKQEAQNERSTLESELESLKQEAQNERSTLESELKSLKQEAQLKSSMKKNFQHLDAKLESLATETKNSFKELTEILKENSANIQKLQKQIDQTAAAAAAAAAAAVTPPPTGATASALSRPLKDVRQRTDFTVKVTADKRAPGIEDVQLLPGGRLLLADGANESVKLFDTQVSSL